MLVRIRSRQRYLTIIQVYAPTTQADDEEIETFYERLQVTIEKINKRERGGSNNLWNNRVVLSKKRS